MRAYSGELALWFREWFGHRENKKIPTELLHLPPEQASIILEGYVDGDGYRRKNQVEWVSVSKTLSYQMCLLAIKSGYIPTLRRVKAKKKTQNDCWIGMYTKNPNGNLRLQDQDDNYIYRPVRSIKTMYAKVKVYDISVEKDHSFVTGFATAHNCHRIGQEADTVFAYYLIANGTIENDIVQLLQRKQKVTSFLLDGKEKEFLDQDILDDLIDGFDE
jgi:intein/homing endonuclease